jgi:hypothetical protein
MDPVDLVAATWEKEGNKLTQNNVRQLVNIYKSNPRLLLHEYNKLQKLENFILKLFDGKEKNNLKQTLNQIDSHIGNLINNDYKLLQTRPAQSATPLTTQYSRALVERPTNNRVNNNNRNSIANCSYTLQNVHVVFNILLTFYNKLNRREKAYFLKPYRVHETCIYYYKPLPKKWFSIRFSFPHYDTRLTTAYFILNKYGYDCSYLVQEGDQFYCKGGYNTIRIGQGIRIVDNPTEIQFHKKNLLSVSIYTKLLYTYLKEKKSLTEYDLKWALAWYNYVNNIKIHSAKLYNHISIKKNLARAKEKIPLIGKIIQKPINTSSKSGYNQVAPALSRANTRNAHNVRTLLLPLSANFAQNRV